MSYSPYPGHAESPKARSIETELIASIAFSTSLSTSSSTLGSHRKHFASCQSQPSEHHRRRSQGWTGLHDPQFHHLATTELQLAATRSRRPSEQRGGTRRNIKERMNVSQTGLTQLARYVWLEDRTGVNEMPAAEEYSQVLPFYRCLPHSRLQPVRSIHRSGSGCWWRGGCRIDQTVGLPLRSNWPLGHVYGVRWRRL